jgi:hypothetical protein
MDTLNLIGVGGLGRLGCVQVLVLTELCSRHVGHHCVRRDPKVLRRVSRILIKEGLHFANLIYIFE